MLGLLGTVTGLIETFQSITLFGTGDPRLMAGGISQALVTTVLGLGAAIPLILLHTALSGKSKQLVGILEEQSAGIIATHAEQERPHAACA
jgi:biopolymer transport protein ExbB